MPNSQALNDFYDDSYKHGLYADFAEARELKLATARQRLKEIANVIEPKGVWLDVGCSTGAFVEIAIEAGLAITGIDISPEAIRTGKSNGLPVEHGEIFSVNGRQQFDCITAFDVIEHLTEPAGFVRAARQLLKPGGKLVLTTPNHNSLARYLMGRRWFFYIPDEHLFLFNPNNLRQFVTNEAFEVVEYGRTFKPMTYDYALKQFKEFNPWIGRLMSGFSVVIPPAIRSKNIPLAIGEQRLIATR